MKKLIKKTYCFAIVSTLLLSGCLETTTSQEPIGEYEGGASIQRVEDNSAICYVYRGYGISCIKKGE